MYLVTTPPLLRRLYPASLIWNMPRTEQTIYLTFDDGPIPEITPWVLETLEQYDARATFFCIGDNVRKHPSIYERILEKGHAVGNHTFNHLNGWKTPDAAYLENIRQCAGLVESNLFRPPYGRIRRSQIRKLRHLGPETTQIIMWDVLSGDFDRKLSPEGCLRNVIKHARNGSIVVFHDSLKAESRLRYTLPRALQFWKEKNFQFKKLTF